MNAPRFVVRFTNGIWQVFDTHSYQVPRAASLYKRAVADATYLNGRPPRPRRVAR